MRRMWQGNDRQTIALNSDIPNDISSTAGLYSQRVGTAAGPTKEKFRLKYFIQITSSYMLLEDRVFAIKAKNVTIHQNGLDAHRQLNQSQCFSLWRVHFEKWKDAVFTRFSSSWKRKNNIFNHRVSSFLWCHPLFFDREQVFKIFSWLSWWRGDCRCGRGTCFHIVWTFV